MSDDYVRDALGWIDDFRAPPGECGSPFSRKLQIHFLLQQGMTFRELRQMRYPKTWVVEVCNALIDQAYEGGEKKHG